MPHLCGEADIREILRQPLGQYGATQVARPLSKNIALPRTAATVDTAAVLRTRFPVLAEQVYDPSVLLLDESERPAVLPRPFVWVTSDYRMVMEEGVAGGQFVYLPRQDLMLFKGVPVYVGIFEVPKAGTSEGRLICAACPLNALVDPNKLVAPMFHYLPYMFALQLREGIRLRVWKRDARHFYHSLKAERRWVPWFARPPVVDDHGAEQFPCSLSLPMFCSGSASFAQGVALTAALDVGLRLDKQVGSSLLCSIWGCRLALSHSLPRCTHMHTALVFAVKVERAIPMAGGVR